MSTIGDAIKKLGFYPGISSYYQLKTNKDTIVIPELKHPITIRPHTTDGLVFRQIFYKGEYDIHIPFDPAYIIDGGANIGLFSVLFANRFPQAKILSIEPEESNFLMVKKNIAAYPQIVPIQAGLWNRETPLQRL